MTHNKLFLLAFAVFIISWTKQVSVFRCKLLPDGKYRFEYTLKPTGKPSILTISKDRFSQCCILGDTLKGDIRWIYDCYFVLKVDGRVPDTAGGISTLLDRSFGEQCFELKKASEDTIFFRTTYTGNVHITANEGRLIKIQ